MIYQKIVPKSTQANESNFNLMAALASKLEFQGLLWRHLYSQRTCVANPMLLTPIQPKIHDLIKISYFAAHCTNRLPLAGMFGEGSSANLVNHQQFSKLKPSKLVITINNLLPNLFICQNYFNKIFIHPLLPNTTIAAKLSCYTVTGIINWLTVWLTGFNSQH